MAKTGGKLFFANLMKSRFGIFLAYAIFSLLMVNKAYSNGQKEFSPDRETVQKYMGMHYEQVCKELDKMEPVEGISYSMVLASLHLLEFKNIKIAEEYCRYGLKTADRHNLKKGEILFYLALISNTNDDLPKCIEYLDKAIIAAKEEDNSDLLKKSLSYLGDTFYRYGYFDKSLDAYKELLEVCKGSEDELLEAIATCDMAEVYYRIGKTSKARETVTRAIEIFTKSENEKGLGDCFKLLGNVFSAEKNNVKAKENYERACRHYENTNDFHGQGNCNFNLALIHKKLKEYNKAIDALNKANFYFTSSSSTEGTGISQMELGRIYYLQGNYSKAELALKQAEYLLSKSNAIFRLAQAQDYLGDLKDSQKDREQAISYYNRSIENYRRLKLKSDEERVMKKMKKVSSVDRE